MNPLSDIVGASGLHVLRRDRAGPLPRRVRGRSSTQLLAVAPATHRPRRRLPLDDDVVPPTPSPERES